MSDGQIGNPSKVGLQPFAEAASFRVNWPLMLTCTPYASRAKLISTDKRLQPSIYLFLFIFPSCNGDGVPRITESYLYAKMVVISKDKVAHKLYYWIPGFNTTVD